MDLSIILPHFNQRESLPELITRIRDMAAGQGYSYEVLLIDDGSTDGSWDVVRELAAADSTVHGISFRRNYG